MLPTKVPVRFHSGSGRGSRVSSFLSIQVPVVPVCVLRAHIGTVFLCRVGKFETILEPEPTGTNVVVEGSAFDPTDQIFGSGACS